MTAFRIFEREEDGRIYDRGIEFSLDDFAGHCPAIGDMILEAGVLQELERSDYRNRIFWTVVGRVFNPRDREDTVALVIEARTPTADEAPLISI